MLRLAFFVFLTLVGVVWRWLLIRSETEKQRLLFSMPRMWCDNSSCVGITLVARGDLSRLDNLLSVTYPHYEVVFVVDSTTCREEFCSVLMRYRMIGVNAVTSDELSVKGVRMLYRSRLRGFRRLVIVDRESSLKSDDLDAAVAVASCDYILPVEDDAVLCERAVERLAAEVMEESERRVSLVMSTFGRQLMLLSRERIVSVGGFANHPESSLPVGESKIVFAPLSVGLKYEKSHKLVNKSGRRKIYC